MCTLPSRTHAIFLRKNARCEMGSHAKATRIYECMGMGTELN